MVIQSDFQNQLEVNTPVTAENVGVNVDIKKTNTNKLFILVLIAIIALIIIAIGISFLNIKNNLMKSPTATSISPTITNSKNILNKKQPEITMPPKIISPEPLVEPKTEDEFFYQIGKNFKEVLK